MFPVNHTWIWSKSQRASYEIVQVESALQDCRHRVQVLTYQETCWKAAVEYTGRADERKALEVPRLFQEYAYSFHPGAAQDLIDARQQLALVREEIKRTAEQQQWLEKRLAFLSEDRALLEKMAGVAVFAPYALSRLSF